MKTYAIFGMQWGDEGKGKAVDFLGQKADIILRYQGGNNAGHTVVVNGKSLILNLLPSGVLNTNATCFLSHGMVIDPFALLKEMELLNQSGVSCDHIVVSPRAHVVMPYHIEIDRMTENQGEFKIGTTQKGIGPCYENKVRRTGIRMMDLLDESNLKEKLTINLNYYQNLLDGLWKSPMTLESLLYSYREVGEKLKFKIKDYSFSLREAIDQNKTVIFEGAQGTLLDLDDGMYPFVTSSHPSLGGIGTGTGVPGHLIHRRIGILKAYTSKVGEGPFPTEQNNAIGQQLQQMGREFGSVSGRPRRCGWLDLVLARYATRLNDLTDFVLTKLDILSGIKTLYLAQQYRYKGQILNEIPYEQKVLNNLEIQYREMDGFILETSSSIEEISDLPLQAQVYIQVIEEALQMPLLFVSIGPERNANIWKGRL